MRADGASRSEGGERLTCESKPARTDEPAASLKQVAPKAAGLHVERRIFHRRARSFPSELPGSAAPTEPVVQDEPIASDPDDPRLDAFVEALACALLEDLASNPRS
jgi:hypothetical protein